MSADTPWSHGNDMSTPTPRTSNITRRLRPPTFGYSGELGEETRNPVGKEIHRRSSKFGLQSMFGRTKTTKITTDLVSSVVEEPIQPASEASREGYSQFQNPRPAPIPVDTRTDVCSNKPAIRSPRLNIRSMRPYSPSISPSIASPLRSPTALDPLPLFQAYSQAIKYATLSASTISADTILRMKASRNPHVVEGLEQSKHKMKRPDRSKLKHQRRLSGSISKADWTQKIFVLVNPGLLLQYGGSGSPDRLPEKMMQLGKDSVAFVSDVIPGKNWVLQISQSVLSDGTPTPDSRSLLSRLTFRNADYRRAATSFLLVLGSAEDLDSWIAVVRREIEALGGRRSVSETGKPETEEVSSLESQPAYQCPAHRDFQPASASILLANPPVERPPCTSEDSTSGKVVETALSEPHYSPFIRPLTSRNSMTTLSSNDGQQLDSLRDGSNRFSYMSSGQRTYPTSRSTSPTNSPTRDSFSTVEEHPRKFSPQDDQVRPRPNSRAINERRRSMQAIKNPISDAPTKFRPHSTYDAPTLASQKHSTTTNFSLPNSSNRRFSFANRGLSQGATGNFADKGHSMTSTLPTNGPYKESFTKSTRRPPPKALSFTRPLSPVTDSISPREITNSVKDINPTNVTDLDTVGYRTIIEKTHLPSTQIHPGSECETSNNISRGRLEDSDGPDALSNAYEHKFDEHCSNEYWLPVRQRNGSLFPLEQPSSGLCADAEESTDTGACLSMESSRRDSGRKGSFHRPSGEALNSSSPSLWPARKRSTASMSYSQAELSRGDRTRVSTSGVRSGPRLRPQSAQSLRDRSILPALVNGPPPAPPPNCALPPLPLSGSNSVGDQSTRQSVTV